MRRGSIFILSVLLIGIFLSLNVSAESIGFIGVSYSDSTKVTVTFNVSNDVSFCGVSLKDSSSIELVKPNLSVMDKTQTNSISLGDLPSGDYSAKVKCLFVSAGLTESDTVFFKAENKKVSIISNLSNDNSSNNLGSYVAELSSVNTSEVLPKSAPVKSPFEKYQGIFLFLIFIILVLLALLFYILYINERNKKIQGTIK